MDPLDKSLCPWIRLCRVSDRRGLPDLPRRLLLNSHVLVLHSCFYLQKLLATSMYGMWCYMFGQDSLDRMCMQLNADYDIIVSISIMSFLPGTGRPRNALYDSALFL